MECDCNLQEARKEEGKFERERNVYKHQEPFKFSVSPTKTHSFTSLGKAKLEYQEQREMGLKKIEPTS